MADDFTQGDEISRAIARNGIIRGSELEADCRRNVYGIAGSDMSSERDAKFDAWLGAQKRIHTMLAAF